MRTELTDSQKGKFEIHDNYKGFATSQHLYMLYYRRTVATCLHIVSQDVKCLNSPDGWTLVYKNIFCTRFATVVLGSDSSSRKVMDYMPKKEIHGQIPVVTPCSRQALNQFEMQARKGDNSMQNGGGQCKRFYTLHLNNLLRSVVGQFCEMLISWFA